ncbi:MAG: DUF11 domain-containing protein [Anaerolineales bacterium]|nr:DUF11 domain-containing protein [Anaerolineales bacterium]
MVENLPPDPINIDQDFIHILLPDKTVRSYRMKSSGMTIGRSPENDIILEFTGISRRHAQVIFDGQSYQVSDLDSTNGTFLENERLAANTPHVWQPGENLRIGEIWLRLERSTQGQTTTAIPAEPVTRPIPSAPATPTQPTPVPAPVPQQSYARPNGVPVDPSQVKLSVGEGRVGVLLDTPSLGVAPGRNAEIVMTLFNRSAEPDTFRVTIDGIPASWIPHPSLTASIPGNSQREMRIELQPPRTPESRAGRHSVMLHVASQHAPDQIVELRMALTISAFSLFITELHPRQIWSGSTGQIVIRNQGNLPETFTVSWDDPQQELAFDPPLAKLTVPPGHSATVEFRPSQAQSRWVGGEIHHNFGAMVNAQSGEYRTLSGEFISRGLIPSWAPTAVAIISLVMCCVLVLFYVQLTAPARQARQTDAANQTAIALIAQATYQSITRTAQALVNVTQSAELGATQTAAWQLGDTDMDGLSNVQEALFNTRPDKADTDGDGLNDGDEVNNWKTNPLVPDSDGDGLNDGDEAKRGLNPLKRDTDGDGLEDGVDPDPGHAPTSTPKPPATFTPTPTRWTSTPTPSLTAPTPIADLVVSVSNGVNSAVPGTNLAYTILVTNKGPGAVANVSVVDNFPAVFTNVNWTCSSSSGSHCQAPNGFGNINARADLAAGGSVTFTANGTVSANAIGLLINSASASVPAGTTEPNSVDNLAVDTDTLTPRVSFTLTKTDGRNTIIPGQNTTYNIVATNNGPSAVTGVNITDFFPAEIINVVWSCSASTGSSCSTSGLQNGNINVNVNLTSGGTATITANGTVAASATGTLTNTAYLYSPIDQATNNKTAVDTTTITPQADLSIEVSAPITAAVSAPITYTITISNTGPSYANNVVLTDILPAGTVFFASAPGSPTCALLGDRVICNLGSMLPGSVVQVKIVLITPPSSGIIISIIDVKSNETDPLPANNAVNSSVQIE